MALQHVMFEDHDGRFFNSSCHEQCANASNSFRLWAEVALPRGDFEGLAQAALRLGLIRSLEEAIGFFNDICSGAIAVPVALCDLQNKKDAHRRSRREVNQLFNLEVSDELPTDSHRVYGITSHSAARLFATREVLKPQVNQNLSLFERSDFSSSGQALIAMNIQDILQNKRSLNSYLRDVYDLWQSMCYMNKPAEVLQLLPDTRKLLSPFLIYYINQIKNGHFSWFEMETLRIWAAWLIRSVHEEPWFIFSEIPALDKYWGIPGGRIDAIRIANINGKKINKRQAEIIHAMQKCRFPSVGWIVAALVAEFGHNVGLEIIDWKFAVGDNTKGNREIKVDDVISKPFAYHRTQMERYLTAVVIDTIMVTNRLAGVNTNLSALTTHGCEYLFDAYNHFSEGIIAYFFPNHPEPLTHKISMTSAEQRQHFVETLLAVPIAKNNAIIRESYNRITAVLTNRANATKQNGHNGAVSLNIFDTE